MGDRVRSVGLDVVGDAVGVSVPGGRHAQKTALVSLQLDCVLAESANLLFCTRTYPN